MRISLRAKLAMAAVLPLSAAAVIGLVVGHGALRDAARAETSRRMQLVADLYAARFDGQFAAIKQAATGLALMMADDPAPSDDKLIGALRHTLEREPRVYGACIAFEPGAHREGAARHAPYVFRDRARGGAVTEIDLAAAYDYADGSWEWYRAPKERLAPVWTEPYFDKGAGGILMSTCSIPFFRDGRFAGVVTADVALDELYARVEHEDLEGGAFVIVSGKGTLIACGREDLIGRHARELLDAQADRRDVDAMLAAFESGERGARLMQGFPAPGSYFVVYSPVTETGWEFVAAVEERVVMAPVYASLAARSAYFLAIGGLTIAVVVLVTRRVTSPIERLAAGVRRLATGELEMPAIDAGGRDELGELARAFDGMVRDLRDHVAALTRATAARERVEGELRVAREIQASLLPAAFPPFPGRTEFSLHAVNIPARQVGGDFFDYFFVAPDRLLFVIADVSGKGIPAAMFMAVVRTLLRQLAALPGEPSPARIVTEANRVLARENQRGMFVTLFLGIYNTATGEVVYANAGHPPPYRVRAGAPASAFGEVTGTVVAAIEDAPFAEQRDRLAAGERLVLYTDGVTEAAPPIDTAAGAGPGARTHGEFFGEARTADLCARLAGEPVRTMCEAIARAVDDYQRHEPRDDVTVMALARER